MVIVGAYCCLVWCVADLICLFVVYGVLVVELFWLFADFGWFFIDCSFFVVCF